jgi:hypothetical protein
MGETVMPEISLPPFHVTTRSKLVLEINHDLAADIQRYQAFYKQAYNADVSEADLVREMARRFMEADREFQVVKHGFKARSNGSRRSKLLAPTPMEASAT